jgi:threonine dehydratase
MTFLDTLGDNWNISLFHYRNHGAADGLVLAGFQVRDAELPTFERHLQQLGYLVKQESNNPAYQFFLSDVNKQATL